MDLTTAKTILANLRERIEIDGDGKYRLAGVITQTELDALNYFTIEQADGPTVSSAAPVTTPVVRPPKMLKGVSASTPLPTESTDDEVELDLSTLALAETDTNYRVCLDFGTAMSKATFVHDGDSDEMEDIRVLKLGIPGDQEQIDENMLVSSVFIDDDGRLWFGQHAVEQAQASPEGRVARMDNIKRALSEGNLEETVDAKFNLTDFKLIYEDIVLAYLAFFTWTINSAFQHDVEATNIAPNFRRRFALPCFPRASARTVAAKLKVLLGEAQILADTFREEMHSGLPLARFLSALKQLRAEKRSYAFIEGSVTEPLGVAGSMLSWRSPQDSLALVVDIGAGTSDFSLYRLKVEFDADDNLKFAAGEVDGTARGITEAGNHLDKILMACILKKAGVDSNHPAYIDTTHSLERDIRDYKETLFNSGSTIVVLYNNDTVEISLEEFMALDAVKAFEESLHTTLVDILEDADPEWVKWVRNDPIRYLTIVLTGGGADLPMARRLAEGTVSAHGVTIPVAPAKAYPEWLRDDYPDLEEVYPRIAVSLGGAREYTFRALGVYKSTGSGEGGHILARF